jgi:hypothetical protein
LISRNFVQGPPTFAVTSCDTSLKATGSGLNATHLRVSGAPKSGVEPIQALMFRNRVLSVMVRVRAAKVSGSHAPWRTRVQKSRCGPGLSEKDRSASVMVTGKGEDAEWIAGRVGRCRGV